MQWPFEAITEALYIQYLLQNTFTALRCSNIKALDLEPIATVMRRRRLEWFGHVKRRNEIENILAVVEIKMGGSALEEDQS